MSYLQIDLPHDETAIVFEGFHFGDVDIRATWLIDDDGPTPIAVCLKDTTGRWIDVPKGALRDACIAAIKKDEAWVLDRCRDDLPSFDPHDEWGTASV